MPEPPTIQFVAFCLQQAPGVGSVALRSVLARLERESLTPEEFVQLPDQALQSRYGLKPPAVAALRRPEPETMDLWQRLGRDLVKLLVLGQPE